MPWARLGRSSMRRTSSRSPAARIVVLRNGGAALASVEPRNSPGDRRPAREPEAYGARNASWPCHAGGKEFIPDILRAMREPEKYGAYMRIAAIAALAHLGARDAADEIALFLQNDIRRCGRRDRVPRSLKRPEARPGDHQAAGRREEYSPLREKDDFIPLPRTVAPPPPRAEGVEVGRTSGISSPGGRPDQSPTLPGHDTLRGATSS